MTRVTVMMVLSCHHSRMVDGEQSASHVSGILTILWGQGGARARCKEDMGAAPMQLQFKTDLSHGSRK